MKAKTIFTIVLIVAVIVLMVVFLDGITTNRDQLSYDELLRKIENGEIEMIYVNGLYRVRVLYSVNSKITNKNAFPKSYDAEVMIPSRDRFTVDLKEITQANPQLESVITSVTYSDPSEGSLWDYVIYGDRKSVV